MIIRPRRVTFRPKLAHPSALHVATRLRHAAPAQVPAPLRSDRAEHVNFVRIDFAGVTLSPLIMKTSKVSFLIKIAFCSGFVGAVLAACEGSYGPACPHDSHAMVPSHCTGKHPWSILHCNGERFGLACGALKP